MFEIFLSVYEPVCGPVCHPDSENVFQNFLILKTRHFSCIRCFVFLTCLQNQRFWEVRFHVRRIYNHVEYRRYDTCPKYDANPQFQTRQTYNPIWNCAHTGIYGFCILNRHIDCKEYSWMIFLKKTYEEKNKKYYWFT